MAVNSDQWSYFLLEGSCLTLGLAYFATVIQTLRSTIMLREPMDKWLWKVGFIWGSYKHREEGLSEWINEWAQEAERDEGEGSVPAEKSSRGCLCCAATLHLATSPAHSPLSSEVTGCAVPNVAATHRRTSLQKTRPLNSACPLGFSFFFID